MLLSEGRCHFFEQTPLTPRWIASAERHVRRHGSVSGLSEPSSKWSNPSPVWVKLLTDFVVFNIPVHTDRRSN
jgi:hypothetical protein